VRFSAPSTVWLLFTSEFFQMAIDVKNTHEKIVHMFSGAPVLTFFEQGNKFSSHPA
jgi:hypothetical protein